MDIPMYDILSTDYDRFVNWQNRLSIELPFILKHLEDCHAMFVLDAATGTGMHAIALAQHGYHASGADLSRGMIERARQNAVAAGAQVRFEIAPFGSLAVVYGKASFDAVLCLGNSLPHLLSRQDLDRALSDFAACLRPGGMLLVQNRNFEAVISNHERWMEPQSHSEAGAEWVFQRFYDFNPDGLLTFNMVTLKRDPAGIWTQQVMSSPMRPILKVELMLSLSEAGFGCHEVYGDMTGAAFDPEKSPNLIVLCRLPL